MLISHKYAFVCPYNRSRRKQFSIHHNESETVRSLVGSNYRRGRGVAWYPPVFGSPPPRFKSGRPHYESSQTKLLNTGRENPRTARATDYYLLYCRDRDAVYLISTDEFDKSIELWVEEPKQVQHNSKFATDYEMESAWPPSDVPRVSSKSAVGAAIEAFERQEVTVGHVSSDSLPYELLARRPDNTFARVAVVPGWTSGGRIRLKPDSCDGIDHFVIYHRESNTCYVVAADAFNRSISLRVEEPEKRDESINWAEEYELAENWPPE